MTCRITVFATRTIVKGRARRPVGVAWQGWNPKNSHDPGRLPSAGSFYWPSTRDAYRAAVVTLRADSTVEAVRVEGIGGQPVAYLRRSDLAPRWGRDDQPRLLARF